MRMSLGFIPSRIGIDAEIMAESQAFWIRDMPTIHLQAEVSCETLLKAVEQLSPPEFDEFVTEVLTRRSRLGPRLATALESRLLLHINQGLPDELRERYSDRITRAGMRPSHLKNIENSCGSPTRWSVSRRIDCRHWRNWLKYVAFR